MNGQFFCKRFFFVRYFSLFLKTDEWMSFKFFSFLFECLFYYYFVFGYLSVSVEFSNLSKLFSRVMKDYFNQGYQGNLNI